MTPPMNYVEPPDVPEGMTLREYRRLNGGRPAGRRRVLRLRWTRRAPVAAAPAARR